MSEFLPWTLLIAFGCMNGAIFVVQYTVRRWTFSASLRPVPVPLQISSGVATFASIGTIVHYFVMTPWYWVIVLFFAGVIVAWIFDAVVDRLLGWRTGTLLMSVGWIPLAIWTNVLIARL
jgi:hypothetical protein